MALVHLVYIHGFQGNDTSFQSFPTDLHKHLSARLPSQLKIQTSIYPTYKSSKPISFATLNFLEWLSTQAPGAVILLGHSMGGLLAAEAATDPSNTCQPPARLQRIIGIVAFDTPYLGIHPHVVISGIASLFPKGDSDDDSIKGAGTSKGNQTDREMNDERQVKVVDDKVTDDWEEFKKKLHVCNSPSNSPSHSYTPIPVSSPSRSPQLSPLFDHTINLISNHASDTFARWLRRHADEPFIAGKRWVIERFQFGACMFDPSGLKGRYEKLVAWDGMWVNYWTETVPKKAKTKGLHDDNESGTRGQVEQLEDTKVHVDDTKVQAGDMKVQVDNSKVQVDNTEEQADDMTERVNVTERQIVDDGVVSPTDVSLFSVDSSESSTSLASGASSETFNPMHTKSEIHASRKLQRAAEKELQQADKARAKELKRLEKVRKAAEKKDNDKVKQPRHFVVLPHGLGSNLGGTEKWEIVQIAGVDDEVAAHCGLFVPGQNFDYEGLIERVGRRALEWCEKL